MTDATLIADLVRAGVDPELIGRVANALVSEAIIVTLRERDASRFVTIPTRSKAAIRAARHREKLKRDKAKAEANDAAVADSHAHDGGRDASRDGVTACTTLLPSLSLNLKGSIEEGSSVSKKARSENARARGQRMLAGAILTDEFGQAAIDLGARQDDLPNMWAEFVDYWVAVPGQRGVKLDWLATWRNDIRRKLERGPRNGRAKQQSLSDLAGDLAEQARSLERSRGLI